MGEYALNLSNYLLDKARHCIIAAKGNVRDEEYESAANRSYYAIFHCIRAVMALDEVDFKKHSAVIGHFRHEYIKTGVFEARYSDIIGNAFQIRSDSDYKNFYIISKAEVDEQINNANDFYESVKQYIEERLK